MEANAQELIYRRASQMAEIATYFMILYGTQFMTEALKTLRNHLWISNHCMDLPLDIAGGIWEKPLLTCSEL